MVSKNIMDPIKENPEVAAASFILEDTFEDFIKNHKQELFREVFIITQLFKIFYDGKEINTDKKPSSTDIGILYLKVKIWWYVNSLIKNLIPIAGGAAAGLFTKNSESDTPGLPSDTTAIH
jgi:hypothetical protein